jgi:pimeloyl-ACP methyl ester carboxylesterase
MRRMIVAFGCAACFSVGLLRLSAATPGGVACSDLAGLKIPNVSITAASDLPAGPLTLPGLRTPLTLPAFCRIQAVATPVPDSRIGFEVWIPPAAAWNGKFQGVGNGGYGGSISYPAMATALEKGYATASTDTGHTGGDLTFGLGHPEKVIDWSYRAIHVMTDASKLIVRDRTGTFPSLNYFVGCSSGGHQAVSEAQRYPDDYNGIVAGDPAFDRVNQTAGYLAAWKATHSDGTSLLPTPKLRLLTKAAVSACDALDGLTDGVIDDPRLCHFDPRTLRCAGADGPDCLTGREVDAAKQVYAGLKHPRTGELIYPGWMPGSEAFGETAGESWRQYVLDPKEPMRIEAFRFFLFNDPAWDWQTFDFDKDLAFARNTIGYLSAVDRNLAPFKKTGGKLVMYSGWADPVLPGADIASYYEDVTKVMGGLDKTQDFFRLFMAPGMGHCGGGAGPNTFDALAALEGWVEHNKAPQSLLASHLAGTKVDRTRPLCPYPEVARWNGKGNSDDAANFACTNPKR